MFKMSFKTVAIAAALGAGFVAAPASAAPVIACDTDSCTFGNADPTVGPGTFNDLYTFTLPFARTFTGRIFSQAVNFPVDNVNFVSNGVTLNSLDSNGVTVQSRTWANTSVGNPEVRTISAVLAAGTHTIRARGSSGRDGAYSGEATLAGVPEPLTWAMMIMGFGLVGAGLRRRRGQAVRIAYA